MTTAQAPALDINDVQEMALAYAARGWAVFPLYSVVDGHCNCYRHARAQTCAHPGKHPRTANGFKDATTDPETIRRWFSMWPASNVAIATGAESGLVVVDIDWKNGGLDTVAALADDGKHFDRTAQVRTQSGGFHLYYAHPGGVVRCGSNVIGPGIDIRGDGGYVVAPPSCGVGGSYYWQVALEELAPL